VVQELAAGAHRGVPELVGRLEPVHWAIRVQPRSGSVARSTAGGSSTADVGRTPEPCPPEMELEQGFLGAALALKEAPTGTPAA
jgi:hypothetical protein